MLEENKAIDIALAEKQLDDATREQLVENKSANEMAIENLSRELLTACQKIIQEIRAQKIKDSQTGRQSTTQEKKGGISERQRAAEARKVEAQDELDRAKRLGLTEVVKEREAELRELDRTIAEEKRQKGMTSTGQPSIATGEHYRSNLKEIDQNYSAKQKEAHAHVIKRYEELAKLSDEIYGKGELSKDDMKKFNEERIADYMDKGMSKRGAELQVREENRNFRIDWLRKQIDDKQAEHDATAKELQERRKNNPLDKVDEKAQSDRAKLVADAKKAQERENVRVAFEKCSA